MDHRTHHTCGGTRKFIWLKNPKQTPNKPITIGPPIYTMGPLLTFDCAPFIAILLGPPRWRSGPPFGTPPPQIKTELLHCSTYLHAATLVFSSVSPSLWTIFIADLRRIVFTLVRNPPARTLSKTAGTVQNIKYNPYIPAYLTI